MRKAIACGVIFLAVTCFFVHTSVYAQSIAVVSEEFAEAYLNPWYGAEITAWFEEGVVIDIVAYGDEWITFMLDGVAAYIPIESVTIIQAEGLICNNGVMLLTEPSPFAQSVMSVPMGSVVNAIGYYGEYYAVDLGDLSAYVHKNDMLGALLAYLDEIGAPSSSAVASGSLLMDSSSERLMVINTTEGLNLRTAPRSDASIIMCIPNGNYLDIIEIGFEWHLVSYDGQQGYVSAKFTQYCGNGTAPVTVASVSSQGAQIVGYAKQFIGTKYKWGGTNLTSGVDCSGFVYSVYKSIGITLNRSSKDQIKNGTTISKNDLQAGDLVFFATSGGKTISHVGIYIGDGQFIHSSSSNKRGVVISSLSETYYANTYVGACRVLK